MLAKLIRTDDNWAGAAARLALGIAIFPHGAQKMLGWFGGGGIGGTIGYFESTFGIPAAITLLVIAGEFFGSLALIAGALSRVAAAWIGGIMIGAVALVHAQFGFFMNWGGNQAGEGFEYHILALGLVAVILFAGGGRLSVDRLLTEEQPEPVSVEADAREEASVGAGV